MVNLKPSNRLLHLFLLIVGISLGVVSTLCIKSFSFTNTPSLPILFSAPPSISINTSTTPLRNQTSPPPPPLITPPPRLPLRQPPSDHINVDEVSLKNISNQTTFGPLHNETPPQPPPPPLTPPPHPLSLPQSPLAPPPLPPLHKTLSDHTVDEVSLKNIDDNQTIFGLMHDMSDDELLLRASKVVMPRDRDLPYYKVAFMFLTPGPLPLAPFWDMFFKGNEEMYSIYIHPHPSYNDSHVPRDSAFYGRRIPSQPVIWGTISMIDSERRLLANALLEPSNQRFVLVSDSCIPVFNFTTVYNYLTGTNHSFLGSFDDPRKRGRGRYNPQMWPEITMEQWRKGSQWFEIHRDLAVEIVSDRKYYELFGKYCSPPCYSDEHYLPTLVNILSPEMNSNRSVTWVDWSRDGPHPGKFRWVDVNVGLLDRIRFGSECVYNGNTTNVCHLFGRKFLHSSIGPLLKFAPLLLGSHL